MTIDAAIHSQIVAAITEALAPLLDALNRLDREPVAAVWQPDEAAQVLGVSESQVRRWVTRGLLGRVPHTSAVLIPKRAVDEFLASGEVEQRKQATAPRNSRRAS